MNDVSRTVETYESRPFRAVRRLFSLRMKGAYVVLLAILPAMIVGYFVAYLYWTPGDLSATFFGILSVRLSIGYFSVRVGYLAITVLFVAAWLIGFFAFDYFFAQPLRTLTAWFKRARESDFKNISIMPARRHDEIGELTELVSMLSAFFLKTTDQNAALMQEKSLFMTIAAHQLRTPLTGLLWSIDSLLDPSITVDARQKLLIDTDGMLKRMRLIVNHILASANVEGGKFGYVFEQIDIVPVITKLIEEFKPVSDNHGVALRLETGEGLFPIYADAERITLALFDLISNAIDYTPKGGTVTISVAPQQDRLEIAIADTGMGISELELPLLFTKFYRSDRARHVRPDGSGLGLFLVKDVVSSHGSDMKVTSKEGVGSRFSFFLNSKKPE